MSITEAQRQSVRDLAVAVFQANGAIKANGDRLVADLGLTASLWQVLDALERSDGEQTVAEIARLMGLRRQSVQRSADILHEQEFVDFVDNPVHKRAQLVRLTPAGRKALIVIHEREMASIDDILAHLGAENVTALNRSLTLLVGEVSRQREAHS